MKKSLESKEFMERAEKFKHFLEDNGVECLHIDSVAGRLAVIEQGVLRAKDKWWKDRVQKFKEKVDSMKLIAEGYLGWSEDEFEQGIDTAGDVAELADFRFHNGVIETVLWEIDNELLNNKE